MSSRSIFRQMLIGSQCAARGSVDLVGYAHVRPVICTSYIARTHTSGPNRRWVGTYQPRRSNTIVLYVAKRRSMYLVCNFKKPAPPLTLVRADMPDSPDNLIG